MGEKLPLILPKVATSTSILSSFTCRKFTTWDRRLPSKGRRAEDFFARKIRRLRPGLNPRTRVPVASTLTSRPPKVMYRNWVKEISLIGRRKEWEKCMLWENQLNIYTRINPKIQLQFLDYCSQYPIDYQGSNHCKSTSHTHRFLLGERTPSSNWRGGWMGPRATMKVFEKGKDSCLCEESRNIQPVE